jgi:hypothetical protein
MDKLLNREGNCVNKISGYKYTQISQFIQQANGKYFAKTQRNKGT